MNSIKAIRSLAATVLWCGVVTQAAAQGTAFTYQGRLNEGTLPAHGNYDLLFGLYDADTKGNGVGSLITNAPITVSNGLFTVLLDFGVGVFNGSPRWVEIGARTNGATTPHDILAPRQLISATPYAIHAGHAALVASNSVGAGQIVTGSVNTSHLATNIGWWAKNGTSVYYDAGKVGVGTAAPKAALHVAGDYYGKGHLLLHAYEGDGSSGTAYVQARDDSPTSSIGLILRTKQGPALVDALYLSTNGNVGIGTLSPLHRLSLGNTYGNLKLALADVYRRGPGVANYIYEGSFGLGAHSNQFTLTLAAPSARFSFLGSETGPEVMTVQGNGHVGIGTSAPQVPLHIRPDANGRGFILGVNIATGGYTALGIDLSSISNGFAQLQTVRQSGLAYGDLILNPNGGNVGIGKTNPATKLDVNGEVTMTACNITSDRNAKEQFRSVEPREVLRKLAQLAISEWQYKEQPGVRHIGPMAQDFHAAFAVGRDEKHITTVDADGVALAAIQGLNQKLEEKHLEIEALKKNVAELRELVKRLAPHAAPEN
jgi:hypothetical protein